LQKEREHLWGSEKRFHSIDLSHGKSTKMPGPGSYGDHVKWDKRTYNLKFLNVGPNSPNRMMANSSSIDMQLNPMMAS